MDIEDDLSMPEARLERLEYIPTFKLTQETRELIIDAIPDDCSIVWTCDLSQESHDLIHPLLSTITQVEPPHFLIGAVYALLANQVQFKHEAWHTYSESNKLRALVCETLAIHVVKKLGSGIDSVDALTYDFCLSAGDETSAHHHQYHNSVSAGATTGTDTQLGTQNDTGDLDAERPLLLIQHNNNYNSHKASRLSAIELAIRGEAKRFLASPRVVAVIERIWRGDITFYSSRYKLKFPSSNIPKLARFYNRNEASLLKLSRLRVPLYRHIMQTISCTVLLALVLQVLLYAPAPAQKLLFAELAMSFWAVGFMLDQIVGFSESGATLYILNLWNLLDIAILLGFVGFGGLRLFSSAIAFRDPELSQYLSLVSYDVLATNAIFLFPRLFSALDHQQFFSPLLIGFKKMATDLVISVVFIWVFFSGFWVAFSLAFGKTVYKPSEVAFKLAQIFVGFTPAAWEMLTKVNVLGKILLTVFVCLTHFCVVTILVSVLSNTFTLVRENALEEHRFLFAVNTISSVKSDSLFFFQSPFNLVEWICHPLILIMSERSFVLLNRTLIKCTHWPVLVAIYLYERRQQQQQPQPQPQPQQHPRPNPQQQSQHLRNSIASSESLPPAFSYSSCAAMTPVEEEITATTATAAKTRCANPTQSMLPAKLRSDSIAHQNARAEAFVQTFKHIISESALRRRESDQNIAMVSNPPHQLPNRGGRGSSWTLDPRVKHQHSTDLYDDRNEALMNKQTSVQFNATMNNDSNRKCTNCEANVSLLQEIYQKLISLEARLDKLPNQATE